MNIKNTGSFIVFEGADNLGKTTQIDLVYNYLLNKGLKVIKTREPGGTTVGSRIRDIILNSSNMPKISELLLFFADRSYHYEKIIQPFLEKGYIILCDRFYLSTLIYQHKIRKIDFPFIDYLHEKTTNRLWPDKTFVFYGERLTKNFKDEFEQLLGDKAHEKLNKYYYEYGLKLKNHILINANREKEVIFKEIISKIEE